MALIEIHPIRDCCGAALLCNFSGESFYEDPSEKTIDLVKTRFAKVMDDFEQAKGEFFPAGVFEDYADERHHRAYYTRGRSSLVIYLNRLQVKRWGEMVEARGFKPVSTFFNKKSGVDVTIYTVERKDAF